MGRKSERNKSKKSPDKSPRRGVGRPSKRRKKSDSESSEDKGDHSKEPVDVETSQSLEVPENEGSSSSRSRRYGRRQNVPENVDDSIKANQPPEKEWKEDVEFWSAENKEQSVAVESTTNQNDEGGTVWKVQTSNGSGGEIQKLRICRQRPPGSESASELSPSPGKDSPVHKRSTRSAQAETKLSDIELPPEVAPTVEESTSEVEVEPVKRGRGRPPKVREENIEPSKTVDTNQESLKLKVKLPAEEASKEEVPPGVVTPLEEIVPPEPIPTGSDEVKEVESAVQNIPMSGSEKFESSPKDIDSQEPTLVPVAKEPSAPKTTNDSTKPCAEESLTKPEVSERVEQCETEVPDPIPSEKDLAANETFEATANLVNILTSEMNKNAFVPDVTPDTVVPLDIPIPECINEVLRETPCPESGGTPKVEVQEKPESAVTISARRISVGSNKSEKSLSRRSSQGSAGDEATVEINVKPELTADVLNDTKEEGEIDKSDSDEKSEEKTKDKPARIVLSRKSSNGRRLSGSSSDHSSKTEVDKPATTAKKHPLITGPEPDDVVKLRRRKLSTSTSPRVVTTVGGTTRQVRSIPGEALKALIPTANDTEKKEADKIAARNKLIESRTKAITQRLEANNALKTEPPPLKSKEMLITVVDDVREVVNKLKDEKLSETSGRLQIPKVTPPKLDIHNDAKPKGVRKVIVSTEEVKAIKIARSLSPGDSKATPILFITNLVRPFTAGQLKELLARTGTIAPNGFYIDKIKSKCYVKYVDVEMAIETRHALNGVRWPTGNPKVLKVVYATEKEMSSVQEAAENDVVEVAPKEDGWLSEQALIAERKKVNSSSIREWDLGKVASVEGDVIVAEEVLNKVETRGFKQPPADITDKPSKDVSSLPDKRKRPMSPSKTPPPPVRKFKKKDYDAPAKLLDGLFRKTKASPCLYWLPLTAAQIAVKEEMRRKHMAEHERRIAELKKAEQLRREKERERRRK